MARYKAKSKGYDGVKLREPGEEFDFSGPQGKWMELVEDKPKTQKPAKAEKPGKASKEEKPTGEAEVI